MSISADNLTPSAAASPLGSSALQWDASFADLWELLGEIPLARIRLFPAPGSATEADLLRLEGDGLWELTEGTLVQKAMGQYESELAVEISYRLREFLATHRLGKLFGADLQARLRPGKVRGPDVTFVRYDRFARGPRSRAAFLEVVPNLAIEVLSPGNTKKEMDKKREDYFSAGVDEVWEIYPPSRTARIYRSLTDIQDIAADGFLEAPAILPGFRLSLAELFAAVDDMGP